MNILMNKNSERLQNERMATLEILKTEFSGVVSSYRFCIVFLLHMYVMIFKGLFKNINQSLKQFLKVIVEVLSKQHLKKCYFKTG